LTQSESLETKSLELAVAISAAVTIDVPSRATAMPAAELANRIASLRY
jgi:hypothetical protein